MTEEKQLCMFAVPDNDKIGLFTFYKQQFNPANLDIPANAQLVDETHRQICVSQSQEDLQCNSRNTAKKTRKLSKRRRSENSLLTVSDQILSMDSLQFLSKVIRKNRAVNNLEIKKIQEQNDNLQNQQIGQVNADNLELCLKRQANPNSKQIDEPNTKNRIPLTTKQFIANLQKPCLQSTRQTVIIESELGGATKLRRKCRRKSQQEQRFIDVVLPVIKQDHALQEVTEKDNLKLPKLSCQKTKVNSNRRVIPLLKQPIDKYEQRLKMVLVEQLDDAKQLIIDSAKHKSKVLSRIVTPQTQQLSQ